MTKNTHLLAAEDQELGHEGAVGQELEPGEGEPGHPRWLDQVQRVAKRRQDLILQRLQKRVRRRKLHKQVRQNAEIRTLGGRRVGAGQCFA